MAEWSVTNRQKIYHQSTLRKRKYKEWAVEHLGGECVKCGSVEQLEFDHVYPGSKDRAISDVMASRHKLTEELKKCQLLCKSCHREKTKTQQRKAWELLCQMPDELYDKLMSSHSVSISDTGVINITTDLSEQLTENT